MNCEKLSLNVFGYDVCKLPTSTVATSQNKMFWKFNIWLCFSPCDLDIFAYHISTLCDYRCPVLMMSRGASRVLRRTLLQKPMWSFLGRMDVLLLLRPIDTHWKHITSSLSHTPNKQTSTICNNLISQDKMSTVMANCSHSGLTL